MSREITKIFTIQKKNWFLIKFLSNQSGYIWQSTFFTHFMEGDSAEVQGLSTWLIVGDSLMERINQRKNTIENKTVCPWRREWHWIISPQIKIFIISREEADLLIHSKAYVLFSNGGFISIPMAVSSIWTSNWFLLILFLNLKEIVFL